MEDIDAPNASQVPTFERQTGFCGSAGGSLKAVLGFLETKNRSQETRKYRLGGRVDTSNRSHSQAFSIVTGTKYLN